MRNKNAKIRPALPADLDSLEKLYQEYHRELEPWGVNCTLNPVQLPRVLEARIKSGLIFSEVAEAEDGTLCGFVFCSVSRLGREFLCEGCDSIGCLNDLYVAPAVRRQGLADRLCDRAEDWLRSNGIPVMQLQVLLRNEAAQAFWRKRGMEPLSNLQFKSM